MSGLSHRGAVVEDRAARFREIEASPSRGVLDGDERLCASFRETMRLEAGTARSDPDVFASRGGSVAPDPEIRGMTAATVVLEVLSPSTERYDCGRTWLADQALPERLRDGLEAVLDGMP